MYFQLMDYMRSADLFSFRDQPRGPYGAIDSVSMYSEQLLPGDCCDPLPH